MRTLMLTLTLAVTTACFVTEPCGRCTSDDQCHIGGAEGNHCEYGYCCYDIGDGSGCGFESAADADAFCDNG